MQVEAIRFSPSRFKARFGYEIKTDF